MEINGKDAANFRVIVTAEAVCNENSFSTLPEGRRKERTNRG
jgi:hypothetical protein